MPALVVQVAVYYHVPACKSLPLATVKKHAAICMLRYGKAYLIVSLAEV